MAEKDDQAGRIIVIGAGIGGLTTAAVLAKAGLAVTVLEAHVYPGGCAGTFYHQGYRFDAGATLAGGFYSGGPMDLVARATGIIAWPTKPHAEDSGFAAPALAAMTVHLPPHLAAADGPAVVSRYGDERRWAEHDRAFGTQSRAFWRRQEATADALWALALRSPPWPPQTLAETLQLAHTGLSWLGADLRRLHPTLAADALRPMAAHLHNAPAGLRMFIDAQLLIAAQTTSAHANALYAASALDLPRRGVVHLAGGIGSIAKTLAQAVTTAGGEVLYRQEATKILVERGRVSGVQTKRGERFAAEAVIANLPPWNIAQLLQEDAPARLRNLPDQMQDGWGAFMLYVGLDASAVPAESPLHHQVIIRRPLGEGNSVFLSLSPAWDTGRAPAGMRALTISTHTALGPWWAMHESDRQGYEQRKRDYSRRMLAAAEVALPGLRQAANLVLPGTPVTFQRFTRRQSGWVGGFAQTNLFVGWRPRLLPNLWMVGDSIFPGQSTAAVALGGLRVARAVLSEYNDAAVPQRSIHNQPIIHSVRR